MTHETFTNGELFNLQEPLKALAKIDVPAKVGIRIARLVRALGKEIEPIIEVRNKLILKYGETGEDRQCFINGKSPHWAEFAEENDALMGQTTKVEFEKVMLPGDAKVDVSVLVALEPFLDIESDPPANPDGVVKDALSLVK